MPKFYGSLGCDQAFANRSALIYANNKSDAREAMFFAFGEKFCTVYDEDYEKSEFFQKPVFELQAIRESEFDDLHVRCTNMFPAHLCTY